jgi:hypothetical protein
MKMRGTRKANLVEDHTTAVMFAGMSPFQFGPTIK